MQTLWCTTLDPYADQYFVTEEDRNFLFLQNGRSYISFICSFLLGEMLLQKFMFRPCRIISQYLEFLRQFHMRNRITTMNWS